MALKPPSGLDSAGRGAWNRGAKVLALLGEDVELSREVLAAYARAYSDLSRLRSEWSGSAVREGPRGGIYPDPVLGAIEKAERWTFELAQALGLSPSARAKLGHAVRGRPLGSASASDRRKVVAMRERRTLRSS